MQKAIERRLEYFFKSRRRWRNEVHEVVAKLQEFGPIVVIGGMIRDLAQRGNREFGSDVDFVIDPEKLEEFEAFMIARKAKRTRFGGYSWRSIHWSIDVWPLEKTWAHEAGHVKVKTFEDLVDVTFFDSDAVIYSLDNGKITAKESYFDNLRRKTLEINLLPNPNPIGNTVRAIRYAVIGDFGWGPKLSRFVAEQIGIHGWQVIIDREIASFGNRYIGEMDHERIETELSRYISCNPGGVLRIGDFGRLRQYRFEFESLTSPQAGAGKRGRV